MILAAYVASGPRMVDSVDLEGALQELGIEPLGHTGTDIKALCPKHKERTGSEDEHPSWYISEELLVHHCFSCGYAGSLAGLYLDLKGEVPEDLEWQIQRAGLLGTMDRLDSELEDGPTINEWTLRHYLDMPDKHLVRRHLTREAVNKFGVRWNKEGRAWVMPLRAWSGELVGYQFRPTLKSGSPWTHPKKVQKSEHLFGLSTQLRETKMVVVESPLDAVRLSGVGIPAVSSFGAFVSTAQADLLSRHYRVVVEALDNDKAGRTGADTLLRMLKSRGTVSLSFDYTDLDAKDPGDVVDDDALRAAWKKTLHFGLEEP